MTTKSLLRALLLLSATCGLLPYDAVASPYTAQTPVIDPSRELMVIDHRVLDDARALGAGPWSFGTLMTRLAGSEDPAVFVEHWFDTLTQPQIVNGVSVFDVDKAFAFAQFRFQWQSASAAAEPEGPSLLMRLAPFRLLAIVNRPDLVKVGPNGITQYGEGRFVFGAYDIESPSTVHNFFVIFEYGLPAESCADVLDWATRWHGLSAYAIESESYRAALQAVTDSFTLPSVLTSKPNGSLLNQLRTNEFDLGDDFFWNLREWNLVDHGTPDFATLDTVTTKQTPHFAYLNTTAGRTILQQYLDQNSVDILAGIHVVPDYFQTTGFGVRSFQSGDAENSCFHPQPHVVGLCNGAKGTRWWAPGYRGQPEEAPVSVVTADVRHKFALQTCSGCHFQETGTGFTMVSARQVGQESQLSRFLTGLNYPINDAVIPNALDAGGTMVPVTHSFNDLQARAGKLVRMLGLNCQIGSALGELQTIQAEMGTRVH